jgi:hypothetical protein
VWALSALHSHHWLCYLSNTRVTATQIWCAQLVITSVIQSGFILQPFILHSYFTFFFCPLSFISRSKYSLWTPNYQAYQDLFNFDGGRNRSARRKPPVRDSRRKSLFWRCNLSSAASWNRTHAPHRHWLQACKSDTPVAPWITGPPRTPTQRFHYKNIQSSQLPTSVGEQYTWE